MTHRRAFESPSTSRDKRFSLLQHGTPSGWGTRACSSSQHQRGPGSSPRLTACALLAGEKRVHFLHLRLEFSSRVTREVQLMLHTSSRTAQDARSHGSRHNIVREGALQPGVLVELHTYCTLDDGTKGRSRMTLVSNKGDVVRKDLGMVRDYTVVVTIKISTMELMDSKSKLYWSEDPFLQSLS